MTCKLSWKYQGSVKEISVNFWLRVYEQGKYCPVPPPAEWHLHGIIQDLEFNFVPLESVASPSLSQPFETETSANSTHLSQ